VDLSPLHATRTVWRQADKLLAAMKDGGYSAGTHPKRTYGSACVPAPSDDSCQSAKSLIYKATGYKRVERQTFLLLSTKRLNCRALRVKAPTEKCRGSFSRESPRDFVEGRWIKSAGRRGILTGESPMAAASVSAGGMQPMLGVTSR
jgi:hypothetical protein